ncbi:FtsX-like permease family protein [Winogradskya consettensis]|uniref:FtsX-like permease family protein n=1 Tax=Winogradskya consettensis TaxID=113560 RepID=UPI001BB45286|nr:FtsX-like permease family protein [Actinoplanes consettensis]
MIGLVLGAVRARSAQALTVLILTALAAAVAVAGPWYAVAAASRAAASDVANAPAGEHVISVRQSSKVAEDPRQGLDAFASTVRRLLPLPDLQPVLGMSLSRTAFAGASRVSMALAYRDGFCDHVQLVGECPARAGDVAISLDSAQRLGLDVGSTLKIGATDISEPIEMRVVGRYSTTDPAGEYWSNKLYRADDGLPPAFTPLDTFSNPILMDPTLTYDVGLPAALIRGDGGYDLIGALNRAGQAFDDADLRLVIPTGPLLTTIARDRDLVRDGVLVALGQVLVLSWFAIGLAGRYTGRERRGDAALLKLRGSTRRGMFGLAFGQHLVPVAAGVLLGSPLGLLAAWGLAGPVKEAADRNTALLLCAAAALVVLLGGLLVLIAVEFAVLRLPVATLLRRVQPAHRGWRADLLDLVLIGVAVAAVYQARAGAADRGLALVAPALVALALALLLARLLGRIADRAGAAALRTGRLRLGLTAARVSRQPGTDRVFTLVTVAVAILATTAGIWWAGQTARTGRAEVELGAARVLTVEAPNRTTLEHAVRTADPDGHNAMAVVADLGKVPPVLAVDSSRLAAVANWRPEYGDPATLARATPDREPVPITGDRLDLRVRSDGPAPVTVSAVVQNEATGLIASAVFGPLKKGTHTVSARLGGGCTTAPGCRLVLWELSAAQGMPTGAKVTVTGLSQRNPGRTVLDDTTLGDISRWRADLVGAAMEITARPGALTLAMNPNLSGAANVGTRVYAADATLPLPVLLAGAPPTDWQFSDALLYSVGVSAVTARVVGTAPVLPGVGRSGVLMDLDAARRVAADADQGGTMQVWLAQDAPASLLPALTRAGLTIVGDDSVSARADRLDEQGSARAAAFALFAALIGVLLAAAAVAVATAADRRSHLEQLRALRVQGLTVRAAVSIGYAAGTVLVVASVLAGVLAAATAGRIAGSTGFVFTDSWDIVPPPSPLGAAALILTGLATLVVLGVTGRLSLLSLARGLRDQGQGTRSRRGPRGRGGDR